MSRRPSEPVPRTVVSAHPGPVLAGRRCEWRFISLPSSVRGMRQDLHDVLDDTALSADLVGDLVLAASEAANNAVEHAQRPTEPFFDVCVEVDHEAVTVTIRDHGTWRQPRVPTVRGRGLAMMDALAQTTVTAGVRGTTVTIRCRHTALGPAAG
ncbi:Anti-sigma regulatory factor (Ser/Thr protein kinase) [Geodermatophilus amargosae]|uniref:Anti-sigma regulatory factor (Ser/Thr protein kinase) n=1 Tax=Geodermatophilus amargosae TaxID=1296565 RepID=A0A1I7CN95_9ACTN|nr:ATP-binding protein [Geodermatophilus amargosae]SFU00883.1 Anti-sigma regulatory factor (Ser/Thr protein kinase) [Geodermatophilus amargosae]